MPGWAGRGLIAGMPRIFSALIAVALTLGAAAESLDRPWNHDVIYFALTDRFLDGDPANDVPAGSDPALYDVTQRDINRYHGGDLRGLEMAIAAGYFEKLGVTALWITPPVRNVWNSAFDLGGAKTGYHGYWAQDFLDIDPHLTSAKSLDGKTGYADSREGRMQHYRDFVALAHAHGIKVIQDVVCNHAGPVFYYDENHNGREDGQAEWIPGYKRDGFHEGATWADHPAWNQRRVAPDGPQTVLGKKIATTGVLAQLDSYGRKGMSGGSLGASDGEEVMCDFFSLRDVWTDPAGAHFDALVNEFVEIYAFYLETVGVDGLRIDTVKHVHREFWDAFTARLRTRLGLEKARRTLLFGEIYSGNPQTVGRYTFRADFPQNKAPCLDSVLNFQCCDATREWLRHKDGGFRPAVALEKMLRDIEPDSAAFNPTPGLDGLPARRKLVNFVENHDGLNRFRAAGISAAQNTLADALLLTLEGIPCLYYGTEVALEDADGQVGKDGETGRRTLWPRGTDAAKLLAAAGGSTLGPFVKLRRELPALTEGRIATLWVDNNGSTEDDGIFAFARYVEKGGAIDTVQTVIVVCNANATMQSRAGTAQHLMPLVVAGRPLLAKGQSLRIMNPLTPVRHGDRALTPAWVDGKPEVILSAPPLGCQIYKVVP